MSTKTNFAFVPEMFFLKTANSSWSSFMILKLLMKNSFSAKSFIFLEVVSNHPTLMELLFLCLSWSIFKVSSNYQSEKLLLSLFTSFCLNENNLNQSNKCWLKMIAMNCSEPTRKARTEKYKNWKSIWFDKLVRNVNQHFRAMQFKVEFDNGLITYLAL